jgi:FkbM family methyltransferase
VVLDVGAYDGDTFRLFSPIVDGKYKAYIAIEAHPENYRKMADRHGTEKRFHPYSFALSDRAGSTRFAIAPGSSAHVDPTGGLEVPTRSLDEFWNTELSDLQPTLLKMDIEGSELPALIGGRETLRRARPILALSLYHLPTDLWEIPLWVSENLPDYQYFIRTHLNDGLETVLYAIPKERRR